MQISRTDDQARRLIRMTEWLRVAAYAALVAGVALAIMWV